MLRLHALVGNRQRLDGGAMFGNAPRPVWERWCTPDPLGRIELACRALLADEGDRKLLFETGVGAFMAPDLRDRYGVDEPRHVLLDSLAALGIRHEEIDVVVLSHLHFDHAGGLLSAWRDGRDPELLFPRARYVVGETAFARARDPHLRDRASFVPGLPALLEASGRLHLARPETDSVLGDRYRLEESQGHTPGLLHTEIRGTHTRVFVASDLVPGVAWVHLPITMGYDRFPERLIDEKAAVYERVEADDALVFFVHDPRVALARLRRDGRGRWAAVEPVVDTGAGLDLDAA